MATAGPRPEWGLAQPCPHATGIAEQAQGTWQSHYKGAPWHQAGQGGKGKGGSLTPCAAPAFWSKPLTLFAALRFGPRNRTEGTEHLQN